MENEKKHTGFIGSPDFDIFIIIVLSSTIFFGIYHLDYSQLNLENSWIVIVFFLGNFYFLYTSFKSLIYIERYLLCSLGFIIKKFSVSKFNWCVSKYIEKNDIIGFEVKSFSSPKHHYHGVYICIANGDKYLLATHSSKKKCINNMIYFDEIINS